MYIRYVYFKYILESRFYIKALWFCYQFDLGKKLNRLPVFLDAVWLNGVLVDGKVASWEALWYFFLFKMLGREYNYINRYFVARRMLRWQTLS